MVISNNDYNRTTGDMVVVAMTSNPVAAEHGFIIASSDLEQGRLNHPGQVRVDKIYTLSRSILLKTFGRVNAQVLDRIRGMLQHLIAKKA